MRILRRHHSPDAACGLIRATRWTEQARNLWHGIIRLGSSPAGHAIPLLGSSSALRRKGCIRPFCGRWERSI